jgi:signal transduction histidine kinase
MHRDRDSLKQSGESGTSLIRSVARQGYPARAVWPGLLTFACLLFATIASLALAEILLSPTTRDLRDLALYLLISGAVTVSVGWAGLTVADRCLRLGIQAKSIIAGAIASGVGLLNVFIIARLMFLSDAHDLRLLVALLVFSCALTNFFNVWIALTTTSRVSRASETIERLCEGDYSAIIDVQGRDEAAQLGHQVNQLAARLRAVEEERATLESERRELTAAASHDLRTPLASVRAMVEALDDGIVDDPGEIRRYYASIAKEIDRLGRLVDELFQLAQIDAGALRLNVRSVSIQEIAAEVTDAMQAEATRRGVELSLEIDAGPAVVSADGDRIERALTNLVRNALEHTPEGGSVTIGVSNGGNEVTTRVRDSGEGIDAAHLPHIWDRFYRAERSRNRGGKSDGAGLGLAIVRGVVEAHGGTVEVQSKPGAGSCFTIHLPASAGS